MPLFGAHMSVAGGAYKAVLAAQEYGCGSVQLFVSPPKAWPVASRNAAESDDDVQQFRRLVRQARLREPMAHASYLINLASPDEALFRRSVEGLAVELQRAERLGLRWLIVHPGAHVGSGEEEGLARVAHGLDEVHARCPDFQARILLETTAGQGTSLGYRFEHLAHILDLANDPQRLGVCFDTCHVFAAGYALAPEKEYQATMRAFHRAVGMRRLRVFHVNDSLKPLGSRIDRHAPIGAGQLGLEPFRLLVNDYRFRARPMILETPKEDEAGRDMDAVNLAVLRGLCKPR